MVNIKDIDPQALEGLINEYVDMGEPRDFLYIIFARQRELAEKYHDIEKRNGAITVESGDYGKLDSRYVQYRIKDLMWRTVEELAEAAGVLKNRPWKQDALMTDEDHFKEEIADAFHFFVEMCIVAGIDADELFQLYFLKSEVNKFRQRSNY